MVAYAARALGAIGSKVSAGFRQQTARDSWTVIMRPITRPFTDWDSRLSIQARNRLEP